MSPEPNFLLPPGGKVMVCAHRYTRRGLDYRWGQGQCFTLTNRLKFDETWEPCRGRDTYRSVRTENVRLQCVYNLICVPSCPVLVSRMLI